jgi:hypothetical protein
VTTPGGKPVTDEPGLTPRFPPTPVSALMTVNPVLVTVDPPSTVKVPAVPSGTGEGLGNAEAAEAGNINVTAPTSTRPITNGERPLARTNPLSGDTGNRPMATQLPVTQRKHLLRYQGLEQRLRISLTQTADDIRHGGYASRVNAQHYSLYKGIEEISLKAWAERARACCIGCSYNATRCFLEGAKD